MAVNESLLERLERCGITPIRVVHEVWDTAQCPRSCPHLVSTSSGMACEVLSGRGPETDCPCFIDYAQSLIQAVGACGA